MTFDDLLRLFLDPELLERYGPRFVDGLLVTAKLVAISFTLGAILGLLLASGFARTVIFCAIAVGIIRALDIDPKSRLSSIIVIACFFAAAAPTMQFLHTSESFIWSFQVLMKAIGGNVDWWEYLNHACFINTIYWDFCRFTIDCCSRTKYKFFYLCINGSLN